MTGRQLVSAAFVSVAGLYGVVLVGTSLRSAEQVLVPGEPLRFCGFYLDCHLSAAIVGVTEHEYESSVRYRVQVKYASNAVRATLRVERPRAVLTDSRGRELEPVSWPDDVVLAAGTSVMTEYVFDSPVRLDHPRLRVRKGGFLERLSELFLVGDPDSWLHAPVTLALTPVEPSVLP